MEGSETRTEDNVVNLFGARKDAKKVEDQVDASSEQTDEEKSESFRDIMERNMKNKERLRRERNNANKSVLRSYRIKN